MCEYEFIVEWKRIRELIESTYTYNGGTVLTVSLKLVKRTKIDSWKRVNSERNFVIR